MSQPEPRPAMTMRQIREGLGHVKPGAPQVIVSITRYAVSVLPADDINRKVFTLFVEHKPNGWVVTDGHAFYAEDGTWQPAQWAARHWSDYDDALDFAREVAPEMTVNGRTATEVWQRAQEAAPAPPVAPLAAYQPSEAPVEGETATEGAAGRAGDSGAADDRAAVLSETERRMLEYALNLADDEVATDGSEFSDDEEDALAELRRLVTVVPQPAQAKARCGQDIETGLGTYPCERDADHSGDCDERTEVEITDAGRRRTP